jgi:glycosyltransferase involved in cell wall biosynthesis
MKVAVVAPFFDNTNVEHSRWIDNFVQGGEFEFQHIPRRVPMPKWHDRKSKLTTLDEWLLYMRQAFDAYRTKPDIVVTVFPQAAASAGLLRRLRPRTRVLAWMFTVGTTHEGIRRAIAKLSLAKIDYFVVVTRREIKIYSEWLNIPEDRFIFVPYQSAEIEKLAEEDTDNPFMAAMGSAHRDYALLAKVLHEIQIPTTIASGKAALEGVDLPDCVSTPFGISKEECLVLTQRARVNVLPLFPKPEATAAGMVTLVEAMVMGKAMVATAYYGVEDYIEHEKTGLLVKPHSQGELRDAILRLWEDKDLRDELGQNARDHAIRTFSDDATARALKTQLERLV